MCDSPSCACGNGHRKGELVPLQNAIGEPGSGGWLSDTLYELGICLDVHVLQRVASVKPIVAHGDCHLEQLRGERPGVGLAPEDIFNVLHMACASRHAETATVVELPVEVCVGLKEADAFHRHSLHNHRV